MKLKHLFILLLLSKLQESSAEGTEEERNFIPQQPISSHKENESIEFDRKSVSIPLSKLTKTEGKRAELSHDNMFLEHKIHKRNGDNFGSPRSYIPFKTQKPEKE